MSVLKLKHCCVETIATRGEVCLAPSTSELKGFKQKVPPSTVRSGLHPRQTGNLEPIAAPQRGGGGAGLSHISSSTDGQKLPGSQQVPREQAVGLCVPT